MQLSFDLTWKQVLFGMKTKLQYRRRYKRPCRTTAQWMNLLRVYHIGYSMRVLNVCYRTCAISSHDYIALITADILPVDMWKQQNNKKKQGSTNEYSFRNLNA